MKHVVGFSGGADSQACAGVVLDRYGPDDVIIINSQAGRNEHPLTTEHVAWYSANVHPVIEIVPLIKDLGARGTRPGQCHDRRNEFGDDDEMDFATLAYVKGRFPSRKAQFCTEFLKLRPQLRWCIENLTEKGIDYVRYAGVRRDESDARKDTPDCKWDDFSDTHIYYPIASWTKIEVFDYLKRRGEKINPLYLMGFGRVGCAPCVNSGKDDIREWAARFPEMIDKVRKWEEQVGTTFFPPVVPGKSIAWVDEVVAWSKTARGGKRVTLPFVEMDAANKVCVSKYGLCE